VQIPNRPSGKPKPTNPFRVHQTFDTFSAVKRDDLKVRSMWDGTSAAEWIPFGIMNTPAPLELAPTARGGEIGGGSTDTVGANAISNESTAC